MRVFATLFCTLALCGAASAAEPIPEGEHSLPAFEGAPAQPRPLYSPDPPRHPHMAPNGRSNIHNDAYMTDVYQHMGPLGKGITRTSTFLAHECASLTFDTKDRIVAICVGLEAPVLHLFDPKTLDSLASMVLPPRQGLSANFFTDFSGGGYFYLDDRDRVIAPTYTRHIYVVKQTPEPGFEIEHDYDLTSVVPDQDKIISALPDWAGRIWFASTAGVVGYVDPADGSVKSLDTKEPNGNSFAVDSGGGVYVVTDKALYRFDVSPGGIQTTWREEYENIGIKKPGQTQAGSGTTPTVLGEDWVAITDNADPMNVVVYRRGAHVGGQRLVCRAPVFEMGASNTDQSLIGAGNSLVVENNYGYAIAATQMGRTTTPGLERVDVVGGRCRKVWRSEEIAPSVVPKLSAANGIVYTYTKPENADREDGWFLTAIDFHTGRTLWRALAGEGLGYNNNYAPVTLGPDGSAYVGVLGGLVRLADAEPSAAPPARPRLRLNARRFRDGRLRLSLGAFDRRYARHVVYRAAGEALGRSAKSPFRVIARSRARTLRASVTMRDGRRFALSRRAPR